MPATDSTTSGCTRVARSRTENARPRLKPCSAHRVWPQRLHRPRSRPVGALQLRQLASDPFHPVEGGSANDYDYTSGDPVNGFDVGGMAQCLKELWRESGGGYTFTVCRVATSAKDLARGYVRIQVDLRPDKLHAAEFLASKVRLCGGNPAVNENCSVDKTPTTNPFQTVSHTRRLVRVGEDWYAFGAALGLDREVRTFWAHGQVTSDLLDR